MGDYTFGIKELDTAIGGIRNGSNIMLVGPPMSQKEIILYNIMYHSAVINGSKTTEWYFRSQGSGLLIA